MTTLKVPVSVDDHIQGPENAPITLVEYGDYQCSFCGQAYYVIKELQDHFGDKLRFVFRNFPLTEIHPLAKVAAETAEFSGRHGHFWEMHDLIYENQELLSVPLLIQLTEGLGLSSKELEYEIERETLYAKIQKDFIGGVRSGVNGTPTFFINEQRYNGAYGFDDMVDALESVLVSRR